MKKVLLLVVVLSSFFSFAQEELNVGANLGLAVDQGNGGISNFAFGIDGNYLFDISDDFVVGPSIAITNFVGKDDFDSALYLPIAGAIRFHSPDDVFYVGGDIGYGIALSNVYDSGVYLKPRVGYKISDSFDINAFYAGIRNKDYSFGYVGLGLNFNVFGSSGGYYYN